MVFQAVFEKKFKIRKILESSASFNPPQSFSFDRQGRKWEGEKDAKDHPRILGCPTTW